MTSDAWPRDEAEFESLFLVHHDAVYRFAFRIVGTRAEAEDLTQEAFLRLHQQILAGKRKNQLTMAVEAWTEAAPVAGTTSKRQAMVAYAAAYIAAALAVAVYSFQRRDL